MPLKLGQPRRKQLISLTPLIDVVFILLLFFMLTSTFVAWRTVDTPLSAPDEQPVVEQDQDKKPLIFQLKQNDGLVWLNDQAISLSDSDRIRDIVQQHLDQLFILQADDGVTLQSLMALADQLKLQGAQKLSIADAFKEN